MLFDGVLVAIVLVLQVIEAIGGGQQYNLKGLMVGEPSLWQVGGEGDAVVGVVDVADDQGSVHQRAHSLQVLDLCVFVENSYLFVGIFLEPGQGGTIQAVLHKKRVLDQLAVRKHVHLLQDQPERIPKLCVGNARSVLQTVEVPRGTRRKALSPKTISVVLAKVATKGNVVPTVPRRAGGETPVQEEIVKRRTGGAESGTVLASRTLDIAEIAG